jgi:LAO/AO transport system kinase
LLKQNTNILCEKIAQGDRVALAKAITLIESRSPQQRELARHLIMQLPPPQSPSLCIAISGAPGVGKSTFIEALGLFLIDQGHRPAVLTVDPSSHITGGSILGDRTRMEELSKSEVAFIRQSPSSNFLGGVTRRSREAILLCQHAEHDVIIIETVGIGQSEYLAADLTDIFCLLIQPGSGDELQGVKKGVMEMSDILVVTKADGRLEEVATQSLRQLNNAAHILQRKAHGQSRQVCLVSSIENKGLDKYWSHVEKLAETLKTTGYFQSQRDKQKISWLKDVIEEMWLEELYESSSFKEGIKEMSALVSNNNEHVYSAAIKMIEKRWKEGR